MAQYAFAPNQPIEVDMKLLDGSLFIKTMTVPDAGTVIPQHSHEYPHISLLSRGTIRAWKGGAFMGEFTADAVPVPIVIEARTMHRFETMTPGVVLSCIHALHGQDEPPVHALNGLDFVDAPAACGAGCAVCPVNEGV